MSPVARPLTRRQKMRLSDRMIIYAFCLRANFRTFLGLWIGLLTRLSIFFLAMGLSACGGIGLMSADDEARIGREQHPLILKEFGGVYDNPRVTAYVKGVLSRIVEAAQLPNDKYRITVLDTPIVNAFALPGGYTYVTRGLLALANSEAELAGVIGHEIAHVTARHGAKRQRAANSTAIMAGVLGAVLSAGAGVNASVTGDLVSAGGGLILAGYSRENEYEADNLGIQALARAGYDPMAQADFLTALGAYAQYRNKGKAVKTGWFASHPNNKERVAKAREKARAQPLQGPAQRYRARHLAAIQGMAYGDGPNQGVVRGRHFAHADLRISYEVPKGFSLENTPQRVMATHANGVQIIFDLDERIGNEPLGDYMQSGWASGADLDKVQKVKIDGRDGIQGEVNTPNGIALLLAIARSETEIFRFGIIAPHQHKDMARRSMKSLIRQIDFLTTAQVATIQPLRLRVVRLAAGETLYGLAQRMGGRVKQSLSLLRVLNHLPEDAVLQVGAPIKLVMP